MTPFSGQVSPIRYLKRIRKRIGHFADRTLHALENHRSVANRSCESLSFCTAFAFLGSQRSRPVVDQETFEQLLPLAFQWARNIENFVLQHGSPLRRRQVADARQVGVKEISRVRVLAVDRMPLPEEPELAEAARRTQIITDFCRAIAIGHAVVVRANAWGDRELFLHQLVHVAQCERSGGLEQWVRQYLVDRINCPNFTIGALEQEARRIAREICTADAAA